MSCLYCGSTKSLGREHLVPRSRGGRNIPKNIFLACRRCNSSKSDRLPSEWRDDLPDSVYELEQHALKVHRRKNAKVEKEVAVVVFCTKRQRELLSKIAESEGRHLGTWLLFTGLKTAQEQARRERR